MNRWQAIFLPILFPAILYAQEEEVMSMDQLNEVPFITSLDEALKKPDNVFKLYLVNKGLKEFPEEVLQFKNLQILYLDSNEIRKVPKEINRLKQLQVLSLGANQIRKVPDEIGDLKNLMLLYLNANEISELPQTIIKLINLEGLYVEENKLKALPAGMGKMDNLFLIWATDNKIEEIPEEIGNVHQLSSLALTNNDIKVIPENIGLLINLEKLFLSGNEITEVPKIIKELKQLRILLLDNNKLEKIPDEIGQLKQLNTLYLSENMLTRLPEEIGDCDSLEFLTVSNNQIKNLPEEISRLKHLKILAIRGNPVRSIPEEYGKLTQLEKFYVNDINFSKVPEAVLELEAAGVNVVGLKSPVNYRFIKKNITNQASPYFYRTLLDKYYYTFDELSTQEYRHLYYGYVFQAEYNPYGVSEEEKNFFQLFKKNKVGEAIKSAQALLAMNPFNLEVMYDLYLLYEIKGYSLLANKWEDRYYGIIDAIKSTGNGLSKETAFYVNCVADEYYVLQTYGLKKTKQRLAGTIDVLEVRTPNKYGIDAVYFNLEKAVEKLGE